MQQLNAIQQQLEHIYEVELGYQVADFVITDAALAQQLDNSDNPRDSAEKLLVAQDEEHLELSLYLDKALLEAVFSDQFDEASSETASDISSNLDLANYCTVLEGVSHFVYLCWHANQGRKVSCLGLEMQAEVDKFIMLFSAQQHGRHQDWHPRQLHGWLFDDPCFDDALSDEERIRYYEANHFAAKYCHQLLHQSVLDQHMLDELRQFYRLSFQHKVRHIQGGIH